MPKIPMTIIPLGISISLTIIATKAMDYYIKKMKK